MGFFIFCKYRDIASTHIQVISGIVRLVAHTFGVSSRPLLMRQRSDKPLGFLTFAQTYALHSLILPNAFIKVGAWQAFLPNLITSSMLLLIQASTNRKYCFALGPASILDVGPLSVIPAALDVLSACAFTPGLIPRQPSAASSCGKTIAALQLLGSFLVDVCFLVSEIVQRRAFLKKHVTGLGPGGAAFVASWPLGYPQGVQKSILLAVSYLAGLCLAWQLILIFFV
eukprot:jgi/Botrbrau1/3631/Bobra.0204s0022.1